MDTGDLYARAMFGQNARHVPAWFYVQEGPGGSVSLAGGSASQGTFDPPFAPHPLRYGSERVHQLIVGEIVVRPHLVIASDVARGDGVAGLVTGQRHDDFLRHGDVLLNPIGLRERMLEGM